MTLVIESMAGEVLVQDGGRTQWSLGVARSGAFDRGSFALGNRLVGNHSSDASLEVLGGGLRIGATVPHLVVATGAVGTTRLDGRVAHHCRPVVIHPGSVLEIGPFRIGMRGYVAVRGGVKVDAVLGSRSTDTLSGIGPPPLRVGEAIPVGRERRPPPFSDWSMAPNPTEATIQVMVGPRDDWFATRSMTRFFSSPWEVDADSSRVGVRLQGPAFERAVPGELPSEPCLPGSIQITGAGLPVVLGPDHPVTGGYPVVAVVVAEHLDRLAQLRPGQTLRFTTARS